MNNQINLLKRRKSGQLEKENKILKILKTASISSLAAVVILAIALFVLNVNSPVFSLQKQQSELIAKLAPLQDKAAKLIIVQGRIKDIKIIDNENSKFDKMFNQISSSIPFDISIESFSLGKGKAEILLKSTSLVSIDNLLNNFSALVANKEILSKVTIDQMEVDAKQGLYSVNLSLDLL